VREVLVPCTGRLQPEHVLKAFESGANMVCAIACAEDNCHYLEGSKRCARRVDHIRFVLQEVGLGEERLMLFHLPGTAVEDMELAAGGLAGARAGESSDVLAASIREEVMRALDRLPANPMHQARTAEATWDSCQEPDICDDDIQE
jgi:predicted neutral ceramidase superfamily lipid hydrolase